MYLECALEKIKKAIITTEQVTGKNLSLPILANIILEIKDRLLKIKSTNLDLGLEINLPCKIIDGNNLIIALNGVLLNNFFNNLISTINKIKIEFLGGNLKISSPQHTTTIKGLPVEDFPIIPTPNKPNSFFIHSKELLKNLKEVWYSASFSTMKPEISSVCFYQQVDSLVLVATDSFRLAEKIISVGKNKLAVNSLIIPLKNIIKIMKIIDFLDEDLEIKYDQHQISFTAQDFYLTSRLIDGVYPDYRQIISSRWETEITVSRQELLNLLKLSNVFADKFNQVDFSVTNDKLEIKTINENGDNLVWLTPIMINGAPVAVSLNLKYLLDGLQAIEWEQVLIRFNGGNKPIMITGVGDTSFTYLIMPIRR
ncbi:MAG: DNA polymerase III subunit beta [Patescibacteria group bacterium]|mgnify:CR=1 FL=1